MKNEGRRLKTPVESRGNGWDNFLGRPYWGAGSYETGYTLLFNMVFNGYLQEKMPRKRLSISFSMLVSERGTRHDRT